jgi:hypothetical protein
MTAIKTTFDQVAAVFSFKAFLITCLLAISVALWWVDQKEAAVTTFTLFSSWGGSWLFTKEKE